MDALLRRRMMMAQGESPTPPTPPGPTPSYTPVDYIQTDGTAYIDTGIFGNVERSVDMKVLLASTDAGTMLGSTLGTGTSATRFVMMRNGSGKVYVGVGYRDLSDTEVDVSSSITNSTPFLFKSSAKRTAQFASAKQSGESDYTTANATEQVSVGKSVTDINMYLFAVNNRGAAVQNEASGSRVYYVKIYSDVTFTTLVFDGVACIYENEYGLWDNVTNSFFGNAAGSGAFTGPSNS